VRPATYTQNSYLDFEDLFVYHANRFSLNELMDEDAPLGPEPGQDHGHRRHRASNANANANANGNGRAGLYRMSSNQSRSSIFEDVEMAHEEVTIKYSSRYHCMFVNTNDLSLSAFLWSCRRKSSHQCIGIFPSTTSRRFDCQLRLLR
jgi:hypothetical protein